jgi:tetratricopeptide (TPR) repeat protein
MLNKNVVERSKCRLVIFTGIYLLAAFSFASGTAMDSLRMIIRTSPDPAKVSTAHTKMAETYFYSDLALATAHADSALFVSRGHKAYREMGHALSMRGIIALMSNEIELSFLYLDSAVTIFEVLNNKPGLAIAHGNIGAIYQRMGNPAAAQEHNLMALKNYEAFGSEIGIARTQGNIGGVYYNLDDFENALYYYSKAYHFWDSTNLDLPTQLTVLANLSSTYLIMGQVDTAFSLAAQLVQMADSAQIPVSLAEGHLCLARAYFKMDKPQEGFAFYKRGIEIFDSLKITHYVIMNSAELAGFYHDFKHYDKSIQLALGILDDVIAAEYKQVERDLYQYLTNNYKALRNFEKALYYQDKYLEVAKQIMSDDHLNKVTELDIRYKTQIKEDQIKLLNEKNKSAALEIDAKDTEIALNQSKIRERNYLVLGLTIGLMSVAIIFLLIIRQRKLKEEKKVAELEHRALRTQMNPHFIFNSMNSIQRLYVEGKTDLASDYMADFADLMRRILDNSSRESITLREELKVLRMYLDLEAVRCGGVFEYTISVDPDVDPDTETLPPMIIQPFVENAIWHGILPKNTHGHIKVNISYGDHKKLVIVIEDNGVGFKTKLDSGHEPKGMKITEQRLGNPVKIETPENGGTRIILAV